jgi:hypothetical protein
MGSGTGKEETSKVIAAQQKPTGYPDQRKAKEIRKKNSTGLLRTDEYQRKEETKKRENRYKNQPSR